MTDSDGNLIPLVEDDQGEGIKDFMDDLREAEQKISEKILEQFTLNEEPLEEKARKSTASEVEARIREQLKQLGERK